MLGVGVCLCFPSCFVWYFWQCCSTGNHREEHNIQHRFAIYCVISSWSTFLLKAIGELLWCGVIVCWALLKSLLETTCAALCFLEPTASPAESPGTTSPAEAPPPRWRPAEGPPDVFPEALRRASSRLPVRELLARKQLRRRPREGAEDGQMGKIWWRCSFHVLHMCIVLFACTCMDEWKIDTLFWWSFVCSFLCE